MVNFFKIVNFKYNFTTTKNFKKEKKHIYLSVKKSQSGVPGSSWVHGLTLGFGSGPVSSTWSPAGCGAP